MNIAIDVLAILSPDSKNRGIGNYTSSQLRALFKLDKKNKYFLINFYEDISLKEILDYSNNVTEHFFYLGKDRFLAKENKYDKILGKLLRNFFEKNQIDVFYMTSPFDRYLTYNMEWFKGIKTVCTLYDIIPYLFRSRYLKEKVFFDEYMILADNLKKMDKILAISQSAKDDIVTQFKINPDKVEVIYAGTEECYSKRIIPQDVENRFKNKYFIQGDFIMCTGGDDDRKNIAELITAYSKLPQYLINKYQLVIACKLSEASVSRYYEISQKCNVRTRVVLTNFVPLDDLIILYNLAHIVAFPSQYEGFGLPVVEAMACGTPVLTSNNSSLGEIAKDAAVLVNPFDVEDITKGLRQILEVEELEELIKKGYQRVNYFTWNNTALLTQKALESIELIYPINAVKKAKLAYFTPLPPIQSGISDYSVDILNIIAKDYEIDVFIDDSYEPNCKLNNNIKIHPHTKFNSFKNEYFEILYQMGNSEYHTYMIPYIQFTPGIVILHDYNLHGLLYSISAKKNDFKMYKKYLYEDYTAEFVDEYVNDFMSGKGFLKIYDMPCNGVVTNYARKIIVHSNYSKNLLLQKNIERSVYKILHYATIAERKINVEEIRDNLQISQDQLILSVLGHIHETKRIMPILKSFKNLTDRYDNLKLILVGKPGDSIKKEIEQFINVNNLASSITVTGFIDLDIFEKYIDISDICINLRFPYNGENSGTLTRILGKGKCTLVSNLGSFSEIPSDCCVKIMSPEGLTELEEINCVTKELDELIKQPNLVEQIGMNARSYAEKFLDINIITEEYESVVRMGKDGSVITEQLLDDISEYLQQVNEDNIGVFKLSRTLAFAK